MTLVIDGDHIAYLVGESKTYKTDFDSIDEFDDLSLKEEKINYKKHFKAIVKDYILTAKCAAIAYGWGKITDVKVIMSDKTNFRYDIYPDYKKRRFAHNKVVTKLKKWARKKYICVPNTEADDVVSYYVRNGAIGITTDKDLYRGVEGIWYNAHYMHKKWLKTTKEEAEHFFKCQLLAGDPVDDIPGIAGVGIATAEKLLKKYNLLQIFLDKGYNKEYMLTMGRLVNMKQWTPEHGIRLWEM